MKLRHTIDTSLKEILVVFVLCLFLQICIFFLISLASAFSPLLHYFTASKVNKNIFSISLLKTTIFTLEVALGSTFIATLVGIPTAYFTSHYDFPGKNFLLSLSAVPFCIPVLIIALGFVSTFGMNGSLNRFFKSILKLQNSPITFLYSFWGIIIAQGFYNFPLILSTVNDYWEKIPHEEQDAARLLGANEKKVFFSITFYKLLPSIISGAIPVFLYCFFSFMIVLLFGAIGCSTLEVEVYQAAKTGLDFQKAAAYGLVETLCAFTIIFLYSITEKNASRIRETIAQSNKTAKLCFQKKMPIFEKFFALLLFLIIIFFFISPLFNIVATGFFPQDHGYKGSFTLDIFSNILNSKDFQLSLLNTIKTGILTAMISVLTAFFYACFLRKKDIYEKNILLRTIPILPMAVSSVVIGFGITICIEKGTPLLLVIAQTALNWPLAFRQIFPALNKINIESEEASQLLSKTPFDTIFRIYLPFSYRNILSAFGFCFAVSCGDTTLPLILSIRGFDTLSLYTYRLAGAYRLTEACACGTILGLLCAIVFAIALKVKNKGTKND